ncbi:MAG: hypothetical protein KGN84_03440 [Acidobacteriota bacterium]|nr:hypothetical protein [Acidobacteriota bacterium]
MTSSKQKTSIGDLLLIAVSIPPSEVERVLDSLARLPHYINPTLKYSEWQTTIEFPAYRSWLPDVHEVLARDGHEHAAVRILPAIGFEECIPEDVLELVALTSEQR